MSALMSTYAPADLAFDRGEGCRLRATDGRDYLDFSGGIATSSLGHNHPLLVAAIASQAARVIHVSNLFRVPQAEHLASRLAAACFADRVFFCNSGAEANEGAVKLARRWQAARGRPERYRTLCFHGAFHGRTLAMLAATGNPRYSDGFGPAVAGFDHVAMGDLAAAAAAVTPETAGILVEPIQGEGGVTVAPPAFLAGLRRLCDERGLLLLFDEVQSGMGRTGRLFAHQHTDTVPDVVSIAKGIAGGFPMGAFLATETVSACLSPGAHGTTFGGSPLACVASGAVLDVILAPDFLPAMAARADGFRDGLVALVKAHPAVYAECRGKGLMLGLRCAADNMAVTARCREAGLLVAPAGQNVVRLLPPLVATEQDLAQALVLLDFAARRLSGGDGAP